MTIRYSDKKLLSTVRPLRLILITISVTTIFLTALGWLSWSAFKELENTQRQVNKIIELQGAILLYDEILTMSAKMAAATGEFTWKDRYITFEPRLSEAIKNLIRLSPEVFTSKAAENTDAANIKLVEMENMAFSLVEQGKADDAKSILEGKEYIKQKNYYYNGINEIKFHLENYSKALQEGQRRKSLLAVLLTLFSIPLLIFSWIVTHRNLKRYITQQIQAENALRESETRLRYLGDNLPGGMIYQLDMGLNGEKREFTYVSAGVENLHETTPEAVLENAQILYAQIVEEDLPGIIERESRAKESMTPFQFEAKLKLPSGITRWSLLISAPHRASNGHLLWDGIELDITKRKSDEMEKGLIQFSLDHASIAILRISLDGQILNVNNQVCNNLGYSREELLGMSILDINPTLTSENWNEHASKFKNITQPKSFETLHQRKDGSILPVEVTVNYLKFQNEEYFIAFVHDITERKQAEQGRKKLQQQLIQAEKMEAIGTLAGGIAHDFNNILAAIIGYTEIIKFDLSEESHISKNLSQILKASYRARDLVKQILTFSRKGDMEQQYLQPVPIIKEGIKLLRSSLPATIEIKEEIDQGCGFVFADPINMHQILINLCTNALHAMENEKGTMLIKLRTMELTSEMIPETGIKPGLFVELLVKDSGCGMDSQSMARIFEPYYTTKEMGKGTGLGLALVHGIVKKCKGFIRVQSEVDKGSSFHIFLPAIKKEILPMEEAPSTGELLRGNERILLVDDEEFVVDSCKVTLERQGYSVTAQYSSEKALEMFCLTPDNFDMVITDQTMPSLPGSELAQKILTIRPEIPIILCTGYSSIMTEEKAKEIGIARFLIKPVSRKDLALAVRETLDKT